MDMEGRHTDDARRLAGDCDFSREDSAYDAGCEVTIEELVKGLTFWSPPIATATSPPT